MSLVHFNCDENYVDLLKKTGPEDKLEIVDCGDGVFKLLKNGALVGVRLIGAMEKIEVLGKKAELAFFYYLEKQGLVPQYLDQGIDFKSDILKGVYDAKRADIFVYVEDCGHQFYDVKCRTRFSAGFPNTDCFKLYRQEMEETINLDKHVRVPVWFVFYDRECIESGRNMEFHKFSITALKKYYTVLKRVLGEDAVKGMQTFRVPIRLMQRFDESTPFNPTSNPFDQIIAEEFANRYLEFVKNAKNLMLHCLKTEQIRKTEFKIKFPEILKQNKKGTIDEAETESFIEMLITEGRLLYQSKTPLKVV